MSPDTTALFYLAGLVVLLVASTGGIITALVLQLPEETIVCIAIITVILGSVLGVLLARERKRRRASRLLNFLDEGRDSITEI